MPARTRPESDLIKDLPEARTVSCLQLQIRRYDFCESERDFRVAQLICCFLFLSL